MSLLHEVALEKLGFRFGINGPHAARTMMLEELCLLLDRTDPQAGPVDYLTAIVEQNILGKPTRKARELTLRHLKRLYGLDLNNPVFRLMRRLWPLNAEAQPVIALAIALARDPLLKTTQGFILDQPIGATVPREAVEKFLAQAYPNRFTPASLKSFAQNIAGTWTASGLLSGHRNKTRSQVAAYPESMTMLLFLGYLEGCSGQRLFSTGWMNLLGCAPDELEIHANSASHRGLLVFINAGGVKEVRFPGYLSPEEERIRQEVSHVV